MCLLVSVIHTVAVELEFLEEKHTQKAGEKVISVELSVANSHHLVIRTWKQTSLGATQPPEASRCY